jgi:hypothetical protein
MMKQLLGAGALLLLAIGPVRAADSRCPGQLWVTPQCASENSGNQSEMTTARKDSLALAQARVGETGAFTASTASPPPPEAFTA